MPIGVLLANTKLGFSAAESVSVPYAVVTLNEFLFITVSKCRPLAWITWQTNSDLFIEVREQAAADPALTFSPRRARCQRSGSIFHCSDIFLIVSLEVLDRAPPR